MSETDSKYKFFKEHEIQHLFKFIDSNNNMTIEKQELEQALKKFGEKIPILMGTSAKQTTIERTLQITNILRNR